MPSERERFLSTELLRTADERDRLREAVESQRALDAVNTLDAEAHRAALVRKRAAFDALGPVAKRDDLPTPEEVRGILPKPPPEGWPDESGPDSEARS